MELRLCILGHSGIAVRLERSVAKSAAEVLDLVKSKGKGITKKSLFLQAWSADQTPS